MLCHRVWQEEWATLYRYCCCCSRYALYLRVPYVVPHDATSWTCVYFHKICEREMKVLSIAVKVCTQCLSHLLFHTDSATLFVLGHDLCCTAWQLSSYVYCILYFAWMCACQLFENVTVKTHFKLSVIVQVQHAACWAVELTLALSRNCLLSGLKSVLLTVL